MFNRNTITKSIILVSLSLSACACDPAPLGIGPTPDMGGNDAAMMEDMTVVTVDAGMDSTVSDVDMGTDLGTVDSGTDLGTADMGTDAGIDAGPQLPKWFCGLQSAPVNAILFTGACLDGLDILNMDPTTGGNFTCAGEQPLLGGVPVVFVTVEATNAPSTTGCTLLP